MDDRCAAQPLTVEQGLTLIEMTAVIVILGILAAFIYPRFVSMRGYGLSGAQTELLATARYARQLAMAGGPGATYTLWCQGSRYGILGSSGFLARPDGGGNYPATLEGSTSCAANVSVPFQGSLGSATASNGGLGVSLSDGQGSASVCIQSTGYAYAGAC